MSYRYVFNSQYHIHHFVTPEFESAFLREKILRPFSGVHVEINSFAQSAIGGNKSASLEINGPRSVSGRVDLVRIIEIGMSAKGFSLPVPTHVTHVNTRAPD